MNFKKIDPKAKMQVLDEIEQLLGDRFAGKLQKPDLAVELESKESPVEEMAESPAEEADENKMEMPANEEDRIHELMTRSGQMMGDDEDESEGPEDADLIKKMILMKKMKG